MNRPPPEQYTLILRPEPSAVPPEIRLRRGLKILLRSCQLRCMSISSVPAQTPAEPAAAGTPDDLATFLESIDGTNEPTQGNVPNCRLRSLQPSTTTESELTHDRE